MARMTSSDRSAIFVLECPWDIDETDSYRASVLPFVEGVAKFLGNVDVLHANFYDKSSFKKAMGYLCKSRYKNATVYIAAHGFKKKIADASLFDLLLEVNNYSKLVNITGVMLGSCFVGENNATIAACMTDANIRWCAGYTSESDWFTGTMIDCSIMSGMCLIEDDEYGFSEDNMLEVINRGLLPFSPEYIIGNNYKELPVSLRDSLKLYLQPKGRGNRPRDVSSNLFARP